jgi:hypothetical protein
MTNPLHNLQNEAQKIRLTLREKQMIHARIFEMADASRRIASARARVHSSYSWFSLRFALPLAALLIVAMGGGTAYAAQGALPGDLLYSVKTNVNEPVEGALAFSNQAKANFHASVAQTRLKEAETLASEGKLDQASAAQIEANFESHVVQADELAHTIAQTDEGAAVEATVRLDSSLSAHGSILARLGDNSSDEQTREHSNAIAQHARSRGADNASAGATVALTTAAPAPQVQTMSLSISDSAGGEASGTPPTHARVVVSTKSKPVSTAIQASTTQKKIAQQLQKTAHSELADVQGAFVSANRALSATTTTKVKTQLADLASRMDAGTTQMQNKDYIAARTTFAGIIHDAVELSAFIDASKTFKRDFVRTFWGSNGHDDESGTSNSNPSQSNRDQNNAGQKGKGNVDTTVDDHGAHVEVHL